MDFKTALHVMQHSITEDERRPIKLVIVVQSQGSIGGTPCVEVGNVQAGFDWDSGKLMIYPATPLTTLSAEDVKAIRESVSKGQSWHGYQAYKKQKATQETIEAQRDDLLAALQGMMKCFDDGVGREWNAPELDAARAAIAKATQPLNAA